MDKCFQCLRIYMLLNSRLLEIERKNAWFYFLLREIHNYVRLGYRTIFLIFKIPEIQIDCFIIFFKIMFGGILKSRSSVNFIYSVVNKCISFTLLNCC